MLLEAAAPHGDFVLDDGDAPVLLLSADIGVTPVLAMLHALAARRSPREVWWVHTARSPREQPLGEEAHALLASLPRAREHVFFTAASGVSRWTIWPPWGCPPTRTPTSADRPPS